ncbi:retrovirus-related Pol polyprotein from type-2 retrotransposable element R2DM [Trichonephila clavipes]|nr:retrovirus-related Pol polyprotein from type-2 retrotransposable element R2DM [Trichonephila clavipes]
MVPLSLPDGPRERRAAMDKRMAPVSTGEPGEMPLAPPPDDDTSTPSQRVVDPTISEREPTRGRIDIPKPTILSSFLEPLDTLLEIDEISGSKDHLEAIVKGITETVQDHFHLSPPTDTKGTDKIKRKGLDLSNHQQPPLERSPLEPPSRPPVIETLTREFVEACLTAAENSAPGPDSISYRHWREVDPACSIIARVFNACIKMADIPSAWKMSNTILIHKRGDVKSLENWRPISLSSTLYKLFAKCLTKKLGTWCETHEVLSPAQKGFTPHDGVLEHNLLVTQHIHTARRLRKDRLVAWLDISNAFGSVPRQAIMDALVAAGADQDFITLIANIYENTTTQVLTDEGPTPPISLKSGVKQGCPLSGILFNMAIDHVLRSIQDQRENMVILAFADDLVLLAESPEELQEMLQATADELSLLHLRLNPTKCATLHMKMGESLHAAPTKFVLYNTELPALVDGEFYKYLGKPVGFHIQKTFGTVNEATRLLRNISTSNLAQWQKIDALKTFFYPSLSFAMRTAQLDKTCWKKVDVAARAEFKNLLSLPSNASNHYLYGGRKLGCCGIPSAAEDSDFYLIDSAFKLLTSNDEEVVTQALGQLRRTVQHRLGRTPTDGDLGSYMSGSMEGRFAGTTNQLANSWTNARSASRRQGVLWSFSDGLPTINFGDDKLTPMKRRGIMRALHGHFQMEENTKLLQAPSQGKAMDCVTLSPASSHFITDGQFTRFADWRCGKWDETLPHVLNHCTSYSAAWQLRHNAILARIRTAVAYKGTVITENQAVGPGRLRPDLVAVVNGNLYIIDVTIPFENRKPSFQEAKQRKVEKYHHLIGHFNNLGFQNVKVVPIVVGSLGAWDPENDAFLKLVATKKYLKTLRKLCVSDCIRWSRDIYVQHLTGVRQYSTENFVPHPDPVATTEISNQPIEGENSEGSNATSQASHQDTQEIHRPEIVTHSSTALAPTDQQILEDVSDNNETSPKKSGTVTPPVNHDHNVNRTTNATAPASQDTDNKVTESETIVAVERNSSPDIHNENSQTLSGMEERISETAFPPIGALCAS